MDIFIVEAQVSSNTVAALPLDSNSISYLPMNFNMPRVNIYSDNPSISIVFSTRTIDSQFIEHIKNTIGIQDVEIIPYVNQGQYSLTAVSYTHLDVYKRQRPRR